MGAVSIFHLPPYNFYCKFLMHAGITNAKTQWELISLPSEIYPHRQQNGSGKQRGGASRFHCGFRQSTENWVIFLTAAAPAAAWAAPLSPQWAIIPLLLPFLGWEGEQLTLACTSSTWDPKSNRRRKKVMFSHPQLLRKIKIFFL